MAVFRILLAVSLITKISNIGVHSMSFYGLLDINPKSSDVLPNIEFVSNATVSTSESSNSASTSDPSSKFTTNIRLSNLTSEFSSYITSASLPLSSSVSTPSASSTNESLTLENSFLTPSPNTTQSLPSSNSNLIVSTPNTTSNQSSDSTILPSSNSFSTEDPFYSIPLLNSIPSSELSPIPESATYLMSNETYDDLVEILVTKFLAVP